MPNKPLPKTIEERCGKYNCERNHDYKGRHTPHLEQPKHQECKCKKRRWAHNGYCSECGLEVKDFLVKFVKLPSPIGWEEEFDKKFMTGKPPKTARGIKNFISKTLSQQRQSYYSRAKKLQRWEITEIDMEKDKHGRYFEAYDVIRLLEEG